MNPPAISGVDAFGETAALAQSEGRAQAMRDVAGEQDARLEAYEATRRCPACGVDDFDERPIKTSEAEHHHQVSETTDGPRVGALAPDGTEFWNGTAWVSTTLEDGSRWDGTHWVIPEA